MHRLKFDYTQKKIRSEHRGSDIPDCTLNESERRKQLAMRTKKVGLGLGASSRKAARRSQKKFSSSKSPTSLQKQSKFGSILGRSQSQKKVVYSNQGRNGRIQSLQPSGSQAKQAKSSRDFITRNRYFTSQKRNL
jgi:hypothetical protein